MLDAHGLEFAAQVGDFGVLELDELLELLHFQLQDFDRLPELPDLVVFFEDDFGVKCLLRTA